MTLTEEQKAKLELVDKLLSSLDQESLMSIIDNELVVARLRGIQSQPFVKNLFLNQEQRITDLEFKLQQMDYAINVLIKYLSPDPVAKSNFKSLKMTRCVY